MYDAIVVLGGGRDTNDPNKLTDLSCQRLAHTHALYQENQAGKIILLGGHYNTYSTKKRGAIYFEKTTAQLNSGYLQRQGIPEENLILSQESFDTITEAFAARIACRKNGFKRILLVTSDKHLERSLFIFQTIFGKETEIHGSGVPCGELLNTDEEKEYLQVAKEFLEELKQKFSEGIPDPDFSKWNEVYMEQLYLKYETIRENYHPHGNESQAYGAAKEISN